MKCYETVWEIFNECANNQMRDVFFDEIELESEDEIENFLRSKFEGEDITMEKSIDKNGSIIYDLQVSKIHQRYSFTEI